MIDPLKYRLGNGEQHPELLQMAFDIYSISAMSAECERILSSTKLLITPQRTRLGEEIIEACECVRQWFRTRFAILQWQHII